MSFKTPVLLIAFNRPEYTQTVFNVIRKIKPQKFYFAADGPRNGHELDSEKCEKTRKISSQVDWDCILKTRFLDQNQGCGYGVSSAISWVFEQEESCIILEDDCLPALSFFSFCQELLERYKNDERIWMISGNNYTEECCFAESYTFSSIAHHIWGWATWKRAWDNFDMSREFYLARKPHLNLVTQLRSRLQGRFFNDWYDRFYRNNNISHTWDFQWNYVIICHNGLTIVPEKNLVSNIGFAGSHTKSVGVFQNKVVDEHFIIKSHPKVVLRNAIYDRLHFKNHWRKMGRSPIIIRIIRKLISITSNEKQN